MGRVIGSRRWGELGPKSVGRRIKAEIEEIRASP